MMGDFDLTEMLDL